MTQRGAYARRNAGHRERRARLFAAAPGDPARLVAAFDWFRSSAALLARRRTPRGVPQSAHETEAARLVREMTAHLRLAAEAIDRGEHDARKVTGSDDRR